MTHQLQRCLRAMFALVAVWRGLVGASTCSSGIIQMQPYPATDSTNYDCFPKTAAFLVTITRNTIKPLCNVAARVTVTASGVVKLTPIPVASYTYNGYYLAENVVMNCQEHNASGLFNAGSRTAATLMMYDNLGGPLTNLTKTGPHQVTLAPGHFEYERSPTESCSYNYTVVSGCVLGATPPAKRPTCAPGFIVKTGRFAIKYCSPCPPGTSSAGANSASCKRCPAGTSNQSYGRKCTRCEQDRYTPKAGSTSCRECPRGSTSTRAAGRKCEKCPAGSHPAPGRCYKCIAGKKCCTVNWTAASGDCPKCATGATSATSTSTFALHTASRPLCLATTYATCAPKITVTLDGSCHITLQSDPVPGSLRSCEWHVTVPIQGAKVDPKVDLAKVGRGRSYVIVAGNITISPPYLTFYTPKNKCTFKYRALTKPAASLLGVPPKPCPLGTPGCPSASSTCPAGQYRDLTTDTPPGPCLPCPPGTYSPKASPSRACTPCAAGTYAPSYGSTACDKCPSATISLAGALACKPCTSNTIPATATTCKRCPAGSGYGSGLGGLGSCLANAYGNICCAAGNCAGQPPCRGALPTRKEVKQAWYPAVLQLVSKSLPQPTCKNAAFLSCLQDKALLRLRAATASQYLYFFIEPIMQPKCAAASPDSTHTSFYGIHTSANRAYLTPASGRLAAEAYDLLSNKSQGTLTASLAPYVPNDKLTAAPASKGMPACSATFKLIAGYAFDLEPPVGASCPPSAVPLVLKGRRFCTFCDEGSYKRASTGPCTFCPEGTYQDLVGATACKKCPAGYLCPYVATKQPSSCPRGQYATKPSGGQCIQCPANTYMGSTQTPRCTPCPKGTIAPAGSVACGVPWDK